MNCEVCGRILREDSKYCDFCGAKLPEKTVENGQATGALNRKLLTYGVLGSLVITVLITLIMSGMGIPILFGALFLPFFFKKKKYRQ